MVKIKDSSKKKGYVNVCVSNSACGGKWDQNKWFYNITYVHFIIIIYIENSIWTGFLFYHINFVCWTAWDWLLHSLLISTSACIFRPRCCSGDRSASLSAGCPQGRADRSRARAPWCRGPPTGTPPAAPAWRRSLLWSRPDSPGTGWWLASARARGPRPWPPWPRCGCRGGGGRPCWPRSPRMRGAGPGPQAQCVSWP